MFIRHVVNGMWCIFTCSEQPTLWRAVFAYWNPTKLKLVFGSSHEHTGTQADIWQNCLLENFPWSKSNWVLAFLFCSVFFYFIQVLCSLLLFHHHHNHKVNRKWVCVIHWSHSPTSKSANFSTSSLGKCDSAMTCFVSKLSFCLQKIAKWSFFEEWSMDWHYFQSYFTSIFS